MKKFKQYLEEGRDAPLYHGTNIIYLMDILTNGFDPVTLHNKKKLMLKHDSKFDTISGISLTRNKKLAHDWYKSVAIELDQRRLTQRYKLIPINYFSKNSSKKDRNFEAEEFLLLKNKTNLNEYITKIHLNKGLDSNKIFDEIRLINELGIDIVRF
jgi:hypothetical protein